MLKTILRVLKVSLGPSPILRAPAKDKQIQTLPTAGATHHSHHEMAIVRNLAEVVQLFWSYATCGCLDSLKL